MKTYFDLKGDGGSNVIGQVETLQNRVSRNLERFTNIIAVGSGKGGVGKSTIAFHIAQALSRLAEDSPENEPGGVAILDADLNGPCQARLAGIEETPFVPVKEGFAVPKGRGGIRVLSLGSVISKSETLAFESAAVGASYTWRATREFTLLSELLASADWGATRSLVVDLPPGADKMLQFADFFGSRASFVLVTIPSDLSTDVVNRSISALMTTPARLLGYILNMDGYYCRECGSIRPLFSGSHEVIQGIEKLGGIPFDPALSQSHRPTGNGSNDASGTRAMRGIAGIIQNKLEQES